MTYPDNCLKGIPNKDFVVDGRVIPTLFYFAMEKVRSDGLVEQSINWQDDEGAADILLRQIKDDGEIQFKIGFAVIPKDELDRLNKRPNFSGLLSYERAALENNPYHGNILIKGNVDKRIMKTIAAGLALAISDTIYRENT
jgi:hypothetical protein